MKKNQKAFGSVIDDRRILIGPPVHLFGYLLYLIFSPPDKTHIPYKSFIKLNIHNALSNFFLIIANRLLFLTQIFSFILITASRFLYQKIRVLIISIYCFLSGFVLELGKIFNSSFLKKNLRKNILNFNRVSIFAIFIVFISIFSFNFNYIDLLNNVYNDDCLICDTAYDSIDDVSNRSIYDVHQVPSNDFIIIVPTKNIFIKPYDLRFKFSTRAPPA